MFNIIFETCSFWSEKVRKLTLVSIYLGLEKSVGTCVEKEHVSLTRI